MFPFVSVAVTLLASIVRLSTTTLPAVIAPVLTSRLPAVIAPEKVGAVWRTISPVPVVPAANEEMVAFDKVTASIVPPVIATAPAPCVAIVPNPKLVLASAAVLAPVPPFAI